MRQNFSACLTCAVRRKGGPRPAWGARSAAAPPPSASPGTDHDPRFTPFPSVTSAPAGRTLQPRWRVSRPKRGGYTGRRSSKGLVCGSLRTHSPLPLRNRVTCANTEVDTGTCSGSVSSPLWLCTLVLLRSENAAHGAQGAPRASLSTTSSVSAAGHLVRQQHGSQAVRLPFCLQIHAKPRKHHHQQRIKTRQHNNRINKCL